ncbi:MAG: menaquinone biosynthesis protein [Nitrospirota bacterium]
MIVEERKRSLLKIGKIPYANLFPIFYMLQKECDCSGYEFIEGVPSGLNRMLRNDGIDISPSSSIEYLRNKNKYTLIEGHSISSKGPVGSILLLSKRPMKELEGKMIYVSSQSETSVALLDIILRKFYKIECSLKPTDESLDFLISNAEAFLSIGDDALKAAKTVSSYQLGDTPSLTLPPRGGGQGWGGVYVYDLGDLWYKNTGLPFVFALWIVRKNCFTEKAELLNSFIRDLHKAKERALQNLDKIAQALRPQLLSSHSLDITEEELISFWKGISYDLTEEHKRGLELFRSYAEELGLL